MNWNCRAVLRGCLDSLALPQGVRHEVIVVDNGSADGAPEMVAAEFPDVRLIRNGHNAGFSTANNQAARVACGRYLLFLNNDTVVPEGALAGLVRYADGHPHVGLIGPRLRDGDGEVQVSYRAKPHIAALLHRFALVRWTGLLRGTYRKYRRPQLDDREPRPVEVLMGAAMLVPRPVFDACGGWDEGFEFGGEDIDLSVRIGRISVVVYFPGVEVTHYGRVSTRQHVRFTSTRIAVGTVRYLRKHGESRRNVWLYKLALTADVPVQLVEKGLQYLWRRSFGRSAEAEKSALHLKIAWHMVRGGLIPVWRA